MKIAITVIYFLIPVTLCAQKIKPVQKGKLPEVIKESSGIAVAGGTTCTMNDSGGGSFLYELDSAGRVIKRIFILNARNEDWEDMTTDPSRHFYIGDFGNNSNKRKELTIYKTPSLIAPVGDSLKAQLISFHYPDQQLFPPLPSNWNFDCEGFFESNRTLYLISKNESNPNSGFTKLYKLPGEAGNYTAQLMDSFQLKEPVTGACISADGKTVVLLTYFSLCIFRNYQGDDFFKGQLSRFPLKGFTQKEAVCFLNDDMLLITDEKHFGMGGKLYAVNLSAIDFTKASKKYKTSFFKKCYYDFFNNPKRSYKKLMKQTAADQGG